MILALQAVMADDVGAIRTGAKLKRAIDHIDDLSRELGEPPFGDGRPYDMCRIDWFDLRNMLLVARVVAEAAMRRTESRGAHQREDFPGMLADWQLNQTTHWRDGDVELAAGRAAAAPRPANAAGATETAAPAPGSLGAAGATAATAR